MPETFMTYLYRTASKRPMLVGELPQALHSLEDARDFGMTSSGTDGRKPDFFDIETDDGALKERWTWNGSEWSQTYA